MFLTNFIIDNTIYMYLGFKFLLSNFEYLFVQNRQNTVGDISLFMSIAKNSHGISINK